MKKVVFLVLFCALNVMASNPVILSLNNNGQLIFNEVPDALVYNVEMASSLSGSWDSFTNITPTGLGVVTSSIPLTASTQFFKVTVELDLTPVGMVKIPNGTNSGIDPDFGAYSLTVDTFYMDMHEVTLEQWRTVYNWARSQGYRFDNSGSGKGLNYPVHTISWYDCVKWCNARSEMEGKTPCYTIEGNTYKIGQSSPVCNFSANGFRLPSGIEREYAARGGLTGKRFPWGDTISHDLANYNAGGPDYDESNSLHPDYIGSGNGNHTSPVGSFSANNYGLFDMVGNINEWCWDDSGSRRNVRGCSCSSGSWYGRCGAGDDYFSPTTTFNGFGFRTVCQ